MQDLRLVRLSNGQGIALGEELGRGGEGAVFPVEGEPGLVAKIYLRPPAADKADKLRGMTRFASTALLEVAAWPLDLLADETGAVRGFLMPRVSAREDLHELYSPKSRRRSFPGADFRFITRVAANLARAFAQVHAQGNVIGDVNHGNALVGRDGTVLLIDCDSFQIRDADGRVFTCDVGVPLFTPPELHGQVFRGLQRTPDHDGFGFAVLLFHLLFLGRHPFAGKHVSGEMPIERAIVEHRFVYGARAREYGMTPPPGTLPLDTFGAGLAALFERAFAPPGRPRPSPLEWLEALVEFENNLVRCEDASTHHHPRGRDCCWCAHERVTGISMFGRQIGEALTASAQSIAHLWDAIVAVKKPPNEARQEAPPRPGTAAAEDSLGLFPRALLVVGLFGMGMKALFSGFEYATQLGIGYLATASAFLWWGAKNFRRWNRPSHLQQAFAEMHERVTRLVEQWNRLCDDPRFDDLVKQLELAHRRIKELPNLRAARIKAMSEDAARHQKDRYLSMFMIEKAQLPEVGSDEVAMLASYGIDSADDVLRQTAEVQEIVRRPAANALVRWANACGENFQFDPVRGIDPQEVREVDELLVAQQQKLISTLRQGSAQLQSLAREIDAQRLQTREQLRSARKSLRTAEETRHPS